MRGRHTGEHQNRWRGAGERPVRPVGILMKRGLVDGFVVFLELTVAMSLLRQPGDSEDPPQQLFLSPQ